LISGNQSLCIACYCDKHRKATAREDYLLAYFFLLAPIPLALAFWYWATNFAPGWFVAEGIGPHRPALVRGLARLHLLAIIILCHFPAFVLLAMRSTKYRWLFGICATLLGILSLPAGFAFFALFDCWRRHG
jgi:hypothetical protein